ncbi:MAG: ABC transporter permease, partial [Rhodoblastus sp.]|nr:ABC transporter permease [Rhodoblastus sp.]
KRTSGVVMLGAVGFENNYALAMKRERARQLGVTTLVDLARVAPQLTFGTDLEFQSRPEWKSLREAYELRFRAIKSYNPTFMYRALDDGQADVITAFSSDGRILAQNLVTLDDPKNAFPHYDAIVLIAQKRADDAKLRAALQPFVGAIDLARMRRANLEVDRDQEKLTPRAAAEKLGREAGLLK